MLAVISLSQHRVSSSKTVRSRAPCGARCIGQAVSTWSAVCSEAPHAVQFDPGSAAVWGSKRINPRPQSCLCLTWSGYPSNDDDDDKASKILANKNKP